MYVYLAEHWDARMYMYISALPAYTHLCISMLWKSSASRIFFAGRLFAYHQCFYKLSSESSRVLMDSQVILPEPSFRI